MAGTAARVAESLVLGDVDWHIVGNVHQQYVNSTLTRFVKRNKQFLWFLREVGRDPSQASGTIPLPRTQRRLRFLGSNRRNMFESDARYLVPANNHYRHFL